MKFQYELQVQMSEMIIYHLKMTNGTPDHHKAYHDCHTTPINSLSSPLIWKNIQDEESSSSLGCPHPGRRKIDPHHQSHF